MRKIHVFMLVLAVVLVGCARATEQPSGLATPQLVVETPPTEEPIEQQTATAPIAATAETATEESQFVCYEPLWISAYSEETGNWVDFVRPYLAQDGIMLPWVVSIRQEDVDLPDIDSIAQFCIRRDEDPGYGRGPHYISVVHFVLK